MKWTLIRSWHAVRTGNSPGRMMTLCGRRSFSYTVEDLPAGKSCETCLRIVARNADG